MLEDEFEKYSIALSNEIKQNVNIENDKTNSISRLEFINKIEVLEIEKKSFIDTINLKNEEIERLKSELELLKNSQFIIKNTLKKEEHTFEEPKIEIQIEEKSTECNNEKEINEKSTEKINNEDYQKEYKNEEVDSKPLKKATKKAAAKKSKSSDGLKMFPND